MSTLNNDAQSLDQNNQDFPVLIDQIDDAAIGADLDAVDGDEVETFVNLDDEPNADADPVIEFDENAAPTWVRELRIKNREATKANRALQAKIESLERANVPAKIELGPRPTLEGCDFNAELYETQIDEWHDKKIKLANQELQTQQAATQAESDWKQTILSYEKAKTNLKVRDFNDAEDTVMDSLSVVQQGIILQGSEMPAHVIYTLGKNEKTLATLAAIKDPVKFAFAIAKIEATKLKAPMKSTPRPEVMPARTGIGGLAKVQAGNAQLAKLEAQAEKTGDRSQVIAFKRQMNAKK